jgi:uncharacterized membrane protein YdjX (TVP38/TMEM64 family)
MAHPRRWLLALLVLLACLGGAVFYWEFRTGVSIDALRAWVAGFGIWAPVGFVAVYSVATIFMIPGGVFDVIGGALFGPYLGSLLDLIGGSFGAAFSFLVARYLVRDWVESRAGPRLQKIMRSVDAEGWRFVAFLRLVPIFPYNVVNFLLGVTRVHFHHYVLATVVFMAPSTVAYCWIGFVGREIMAGQTDQIHYALGALGLLGVLFFLPRFVKRARRNGSMN